MKCLKVRFATNFVVDKNLEYKLDTNLDTNNKI